MLKRSDFNDERFLFEMAKLLEYHPLNGIKYSQKEIKIPNKDSHFYITIENKEINDPISVTITRGNCDAVIMSSKSLHALPKEINITRFINT